MGNGKNTKNPDIENILCKRIQPRGVEKFTNDDFGVVGYLIPRNVIQKRLRIAESDLYNKCIYFLIGTVNTKEAVYVGQADVRNNGESVLKRLQEHIDSTEPFKDIWDTAMVFTGKDNSWEKVNLKPLEHYFYKDIPKDQCLNRNTPNSGGEGQELYNTKMNQIKAYFNAASFNIFAEYEDELNKNVAITYEDEADKAVDKIASDGSRITEVITPRKVVKRMVDNLPQWVWNDETKFLDLSCKGGEYLREIYDRLMADDKMQAKYTDIIERSNHILKYQIYGIALSEESHKRTSRKLSYGDFNIKEIDGFYNKLQRSMMKKKAGDTQKIMVDAINEAFGGEMNFNVIIGNPPYQETTGGGSTGQAGKAIYQLFMDTALDLAEYSKENCAISMITPTKWISSDDKETRAIRNRMLDGNHIESFVDYMDSRKCFIGVMINGGVSYWVWDKDYVGTTQWTTISNAVTETNERDLHKNDIILRHCIADSILEKVQAKSNDYMERYIFKKNKWGFESDCWRSLKYSNVRLHESDTMLITSGGDFYIPEKVGYIENDCKVVFGAVTSGEVTLPRRDGKYRVLSILGTYGKNTIMSQSYMCIGNISSMEIAQNIEKYLKTKFARFMVLQTISGLGLKASNFRYVPIVDLHHAWTDKMLYDYFELDDKEREYIEQIMLPIGDIDQSILNVSAEAKNASYVRGLMNTQ